MAGRKTVLFTTHQPALLTELQRERPDLAVMVIGSTVPPLDPSSAIWCFVDFVMHPISGIEMCRRLRNELATHEANVTMVFEELDSDLVSRALKAGADDYTIGTLAISDILHRLGTKSIPTTWLNAKIELGELAIEPLARRIRYRGQRVDLAPNEFNLLLHLAHQPDRVFTREDIIKLIGKPSEEIDTRTVDVWIGRLRKALKLAGAPDIIRTVRPMGYMLEIN
ncbi:MAG: winged helix-turn-helix domain-containing protein [Sphingomonadales bacterium]